MGLWMVCRCHDAARNWIPTERVILPLTKLPKWAFKLATNWTRPLRLHLPNCTISMWSLRSKTKQFILIACGLSWGLSTEQQDCVDIICLHLCSQMNFFFLQPYICSMLCVCCLADPVCGMFTPAWSLLWAIFTVKLLCVIYLSQLKWYVW